MHFCAGLPIILVGCKKDLRRDPRVVDELRKTNQRPVTPEEVRFLPPSISLLSRDTNDPVLCVSFSRVWPWRTRLAPSTIWNARRERVRAYVKCSSMPRGLPSSVDPRTARDTVVWFCRLPTPYTRSSVCVSSFLYTRTPIPTAPLSRPLYSYVTWGGATPSILFSVLSLYREFIPFTTRVSNSMI